MQPSGGTAATVAARWKRRGERGQSCASDLDAGFVGVRKVCRCTGFVASVHVAGRRRAVAGGAGLPVVTVTTCRYCKSAAQPRLENFEPGRSARTRFAARGPDRGGGVSADVVRAAPSQNTTLRRVPGAHYVARTRELTSRTVVIYGVRSMTRSTRPYSSASSAEKKLSRSRSMTTCTRQGTESDEVAAA